MHTIFCLIRLFFPQGPAFLDLEYINLALSSKILNITVIEKADWNYSTNELQGTHWYTDSTS